MPSCLNLSASPPNWLRSPLPQTPHRAPPDDVDGRVFECRHHESSATSNAVTLRVLRLNSTPIRWMGSPRPLYLAA